MRRGGGPDSVPQNGGTGAPVGGRPGHGQNGARPGDQPGAGSEGALLSHGRQRGVQQRGEKDGDPHGEFPAGHRPPHQGEQRGVRGGGHGAGAGGDGEPAGGLRPHHLPRGHRAADGPGLQDAPPRPLHLRGAHQGERGGGRRHLRGGQLRRRQTRGTVRRARRRIRPGGGGVRAPAQGGGAQKTGGGAGRDPARPRRGERAAAGRGGRGEPHGVHGQAQKDGDYGKTAHGDQPGGQPVHRPGRRGARAGGALHRRGAHARHRVFHLSQQEPREHALPHRHLRDEPGGVPDSRDGRARAPRRARGSAGPDAHRADHALQRGGDDVHYEDPGGGGGDGDGRGGASAARGDRGTGESPVLGADAHPGTDTRGDEREDGVHGRGREGGRRPLFRWQGQRQIPCQDRRLHEVVVDAPERLGKRACPILYTWVSTSASYIKYATDIYVSIFEVRKYDAAGDGIECKHKHKIHN
mmetsp:Transcript_41919/g.82179  ORF Transcript_41919/g.82179 Transcript_41919/m.82179 type:complete len:468 (-) Transcript_41919:15-1418(-)